MKYVVIIEEYDGESICWLNGEANMNNLQLSDFMDDKITCDTVSKELSVLYPNNKYTVRPVTM